MDLYSRRNLEDLVVPNYNESSDSYPSPDVWNEWNMMNSTQAVDKSFDYDVINNGFSGGLYSQMEIKEESLHDFNGIQQIDDIFLSSILEDVPGNGNSLHSFKESDSISLGTSSAYLDTLDGREVPMFHYNWEPSQDMPMEDDTPMNMCEEKNIEEASAEEVVLQDLQRATEKMTDNTRKCFRDTFYRLAKNSQHKSESRNNYSKELLEDGTRKQETELETNSIDRAVANLTFNKMESNMRNLPPQKRVSSIQG